MDQDEQQPYGKTTVTTQSGGRCEVTRQFKFHQYGSATLRDDGQWELDGSFEIRAGDSFINAKTYGDETYFQTRTDGELWQGTLTPNAGLTAVVQSLHEAVHGNNAPHGWLHTAYPNTLRSKHVAAATLRALGVECVDAAGHPSVPYLNASDIYQLGTGGKGGRE